MKSFKFKSLQALALLGSATMAIGVGAQTVYRCGNTYSQTPCAGATEVPVDDARTEAQRTAAQEGLARDKTLGKELEASRRKDEAQALARDKAVLAAQTKQVAKEKAGNKKAQEKQKTASKKSGSKAKDHEVFTVTVAGTKADSKHLPKSK